MTQTLNPTTWTNKAGSLMAIANSAEHACTLWQDDLQAAIEDGRCTLEDLGGTLPVYEPRRARQIVTDLASYANDDNGPGHTIVRAAAQGGNLYEYE